MIEQRIKSLVNDRTIEATRKELSKKLQVIVKAFGKPIIEQTVPYNALPDFWETKAPEIPEINDDHIYLRGYYFDGLNRGVNLCIKMTIYDSHLAELRVTYNGYQVFLEGEGELKSYAPFKSWEDAVERLYTYAKPTAEEKVKKELEEKRKENRKKAMTIMDKLRLLWGI